MELRHVVPDLSKCPKPIELCKQGNFEQLFNIYDTLESNNLDICGYRPSDFLYEEISSQQSTEKHNKDLPYYSDGKLIYKAIHYAAIKGNVKAVKKLVERYKCSPHVKAKGRDYDYFKPKTPLELACYFGHYDVAHYFVVEQKCAVKYFCTSMIKTVSAVHGRRKTISYLHYKQYYGHKYLQIVNLLINHNQGGVISSEVALVLALAYGNSENLVHLSKYINLKKELAEDLRNPEYRGPFITAVLKCNNLDAIEYIISYCSVCVDVSLFYSAIECKSSPDVFLILLKHCDNGSVMFGKSCESKEECLFLSLVNYLLEEALQGCLLLVRELLAKFGGVQDHRKQCLLHYACAARNIEAAELLVKYRPGLQCVRDEQLQLPLHVACTQGCKLVTLVSEYCDIDALDKDGNTPLHIACTGKNWNVVEFFLYHKNPSLFIRNNEECSPLTLILKHHHQILDDCNLNELNLGNNIINEIYENENTLIHYACQCCNLNFIRHLTSCLHAPVHLKNLTGNLPLHDFLDNLRDSDSWKSTRMEDIRLLCKDNLQIINGFDGRSKNALQIICCRLWKGREDIQFDLLEYLVSDLGASIEIPDCHGNLILHMIASWQWDAGSISAKMTKIFDLFANRQTIDAQNCSGDTALHIACGSDLLCESLIRYLIKEKHASVSVCDKTGWLPVHYYLMKEPIAGQDLSCLEILLKNIDVNVQDSSGNTLLHLACRHFLSESSIISYLVKCKGAFINIQNNDNELPLHVLLHSKCSNPYVIKLLVDKANLFVQDKDGNTPLHVAFQNHYLPRGKFKDTVCSSSQLFVAVNLNFSSGLNNSFLQVRETLFDLLMIKNSNNLTPLQILINRTSLCHLRFFTALFSLDDPRYNEALCRNLTLRPILEKYSAEIMRGEYDLLHSLANAFNVTTRDQYGRTLIHHACLHRDVYAILHSIESSVNSVNLQDDSGMTPLHIACVRCHKDAIQYLLAQEGCIHNIKDYTGNIPLHYSARQGYIHDSLPISKEDLHVLNNKGLSPLHVAIKSKHLKIAEILIIKHGTQCSMHLQECGIRISTIFTVLYEALCDLDPSKPQYEDELASGIHILKLLTNLGAPLQSSSKKWLHDWTFKLSFVETEKYTEKEMKFSQHEFMLRRPPFSEVDRTKLMHMAAWHDRSDILKYLIEEEQCDPHVTDRYGDNTLSYACKVDDRANECLPGSQFST